MAAQRSRWARVFISPLAGLLLLSLLWSLGSLRYDLLGIPRNPLREFARQTPPLAMFTVAAMGIALARKSRWPRGRPLWDAILVGIGLFVVPAWLIYYAEDEMNGLTRAALLTLAPVFTVAIEPNLSGQSSAGPAQMNRGSLMAALAAVAGTLFAFPVRFPNTVESARSFCSVILAAACIAAANCWAVRQVTVEEEEEPTSSSALAAIAGATGTVGLILLSAVNERMRPITAEVRTEFVWSAIVELPALLLLFWLMPRMTATRMTTRYVLTLLISTLILSIGLRAWLGWRTAIGLVLMGAGVAYLLLAREEAPEPGWIPHE